MTSSGSAPIFSRRLRREIVLLISVKLLLLFVIYRVFFAGHEVPPLGSGAVADHILQSFSRR